tara:strand:+ start:495 stop:857 length:363 start_codon:yes stop_codon:yes gene_type:complete
MDLASKDQYIQRAVSAKLDVGSTALTTVYTAPTGGDFDFAILESILVANDATQATTVSFTITDSSSNNFVIFKDASFTNKETKEMLSKSLILTAGELLKIEVSHANINVVVSLIEYAKGD